MKRNSSLSDDESRLLRTLGESVSSTLEGDIESHMATFVKVRKQTDDPVGVGEHRALVASSLGWLSEAGMECDDGDLLFPAPHFFTEKYRVTEAALLERGWLYIEDGDLIFGTHKMWDWYFGSSHSTESELSHARSQYQFLPDLTPEEFESLKSSIAEKGVEVPIITDQDDNIVEGFHRQRACDELRIFCPREVRHFASVAEKFELALRLNCRRRQLNRTQKRDLIAAYLQRDPKIADNFLSEIIGGVSKNTVAEVRHQLEATCQIDKFEKLRGRDSKERPSKYKSIIANTPKEAETAANIIGDLPDNCEGKILDVTTAQRRAKRNRKKQERDQKRRRWSDSPINRSDMRERIRLFQCPFQNLQQTAAIRPESVQLLLTDIPYDKKFVSQVPELAALGHRILAPGSILAVMTGVYWEDRISDNLSKSFNCIRHCKLIAPWRGDGNVLQRNGIRVINHYKPVLVYAKGEPAKAITVGNDILPEAPQSKYWHEWQQPLEQIKKIIQYFSDEGDLVVDPCGGGFTTAIACWHENRRFIGCDVEEACVNAGQTRLRLAESLDAFVFDVTDMGGSVTSESILCWTAVEGIDAECASHVINDLPDDLKALVKEEVPMSIAELPDAG